MLRGILEGKYNEGNIISRGNIYVAFFVIVTAIVSAAHSSVTMKAATKRFRQ